MNVRIENSAPSPDDLRPALQPPRFGLGALFGGVALFSILFAIIHYFGAYGAALAILFGLCVGAHVVGNALGIQLQKNGDRPQRADGEPAVAVWLPVRPGDEDFAPATRLRQRYSLGSHVPVLTAIGAVASAALGCAGITWLADESTSWTVIVVGALAAGVLGGIWCFLTICFFQVTLREFLDPQSEQPGT